MDGPAPRSSPSSRSASTRWATSWTAWWPGSPSTRARASPEQAEGIPLFAVETVRALVDRSVLVPGPDGRLTLEGDLGQLDVPASLSSLLAARLDALDPDERERGQGDGRLRRQLPARAPSRRSAGLEDEQRLDDTLASLVRKQVFVVRADPLSPDRGQYAFAQTLLRTVAYEMLSRRERKARHLSAAEHLRQAFPDDGEDVAEVIAHHYLDAYHAAQGDPDEEEHRARALTAMRRAAQRALTVGAPDTAKHAFRTAAELADDERERIELIAAAADAAMRAGEWASAIELFDAASQAHRSAGREHDAARLAPAHGEALRRLGRVEVDIALVREALALLGEDAVDPDVAALNGELGAALTFHGEYAAAAPALERALQVAEALGLPQVICNALGRKSLLSAWNGRPVEARVLFDGGISLAEENGLTDELQSLCNNAGDLSPCAPRSASRSPHRPQALQEPFDSPARVAARLLLIVRPGHVERRVVEGPEQHVGQGPDRQALDRARVHRRLQRHLHEPGPVALADLAPALPSEDGRGVEQRDLLHRRIDAGVEEGARSQPQRLHGVGGGRSDGAEVLRELRLQLLEDGDEEVLLAAEVVVERAAGHAGGADDLLGAHCAVAALGEELARCGDEGRTGRGGLLGLPAGCTHTGCM